MATMMLQPLSAHSDWGAGNMDKLAVIVLAVVIGAIVAALISWVAILWVISPITPTNLGAEPVGAAGGEIGLAPDRRDFLTDLCALQFADTVGCAELRLDLAQVRG